MSDARGIQPVDLPDGEMDCVSAGAMRETSPIAEPIAEIKQFDETPLADLGLGRLEDAASSGASRARLAGGCPLWSCNKTHAQ
ncbi:MAG TPA: hypothetical protein VMA37_02875 [Acetobacteraceae bacterium]|nr:hypothetical protein [Acetobacteraceae bacterium]